MAKELNKKSEGRHKFSFFCLACNVTTCITNTIQLTRLEIVELLYYDTGQELLSLQTMYGATRDLSEQLASSSRSNHHIRNRFCSDPALCCLSSLFSPPLTFNLCITIQGWMSKMYETWWHMGFPQQTQAISSINVCNPICSPIATEINMTTWPFS